MAEAAGRSTVPLTLGALAVGIVGGLMRGGKAKHRRQS